MFDYIDNRRGKKIFAVIDHPPQTYLRGGYRQSKAHFGGGVKFPAILIIHGFKGWSAQRHLQGISDALVKRGFLTIGPDLTHDPGRSYLEFADMTYGQELKDTEDVLDYLLNLDEVDKNRIGVTGHSLAGMIVAELASKRREVKALATLSAVYDFKWIADKIFKKPFERAKKDFRDKGFTNVWSKELEKRLKVKKSFWEDAFERTAKNFAEDIKCPTLVVSSGSDESVSQSHADKYIKTVGAKDKKMEIIEGSNHNYSGGNLEKVASIVANWFSQKLKN